MAIELLLDSWLCTWEVLGSVVGSCRGRIAWRNVVGAFGKRSERALSNLKCCQTVDLGPGRMDCLGLLWKSHILCERASLPADRSASSLAWLAACLSALRID